VTEVGPEWGLGQSRTVPSCSDRIRRYPAAQVATLAHENEHGDWREPSGDALTSFVSFVSVFLRICVSAFCVQLV